MTELFNLLSNPVVFILFYGTLVVGFVLPIYYFSSPVRQWKTMVKRYRDTSLFQGEKTFFTPQHCRINYGIYSGVFSVGTNVAGIFFDFTFARPFFIPWLDILYIREVDEQYCELKIEGLRNLIFQLPKEIFEKNPAVPPELIIRKEK